MYCIIKYVAQMSEIDELLYINPDCVLQLLLDYIRQELGISCENEFDLCDEQGERKNVNEYEPHIRATQILEPFTIYICVIIEKDENDKINKLTPLISTTTKQYTELCLKLRRYINPSKRFSYELKKNSCISVGNIQSASLPQILEKPKKRHHKKETIT